MMNPSASNEASNKKQKSFTPQVAGYQPPSGGMNLQKIICKIPITSAEIAKPEIFFKIFSSWIPNSPEVFVDVASYEHVPDGPKVVLIGHYLDCALDDTDHELGFVLRRKRGLTGSLSERFEQTLRECQLKAKGLTESLELSDLKLSENKIILIINDRQFSGTEFQVQIKSDLATALKNIDPEKKFSITENTSSGRCEYWIDLKH